MAETHFELRLKLIQNAILGFLSQLFGTERRSVIDL